MCKHYVNTISDLYSEAERRKKEQPKIQKKVDAFIKQKYGIPGFSAKIKTFFKLKEDTTYLSLCRQIPSVRNEDVTCAIASKIIGFPLLSLAFLDDSFSTNGHEKRAYLDIIWSNFGRKGNHFLQNQKIYQGIITESNNRTLRSIRTNEKTPGTYAHDFHFDLRKQVFENDDLLLDVSDLHRDLVRSAKKKPTELCAFDHEGNTVRTPTKRVDLSTSHFRPYASWYYPLYFSWFLDGSMVLLETYENELSQVSEAKKVFMQTVEEIEAGVGLKPLILQIPPLDPIMLSIPKPVLSQPNKALETLYANCREASSGNSVEFFQHIAQNVANWKE